MEPCKCREGSCRAGECSTGKHSLAGDSDDCKRGDGEGTWAELGDGLDRLSLGAYVEDLLEISCVALRGLCEE